VLRFLAGVALGVALAFAGAGTWYFAVRDGGEDDDSVRARIYAVALAKEGDGSVVKYRRVADGLYLVQIAGQGCFAIERDSFAPNQQRGFFEAPCDF
jgi:hypothetical protein